MKKKNYKKEQDSLESAPIMPSEYKPSKTFDEYYYDFTIRKTRPVSKEFVENLSEDLIIWARDNESAFKITQYFNRLGFFDKDIKRWSAKYEFFADAYAIALSMIGDRREMAGLNKNMDAGIVSYTMAHYDKSWKDLAEWRAKLRQTEEKTDGPQIVVIERTPSSDLVPDKPSKTPEEVGSDARKKATHSSQYRYTKKK